MKRPPHHCSETEPRDDGVSLVPSRFEGLWLVRYRGPHGPSWFWSPWGEWVLSIEVVDAGCRMSLADARTHFHSVQAPTEADFPPPADPAP